ncbi:MAG: hypothetical protein K5696_07750 [Lachnospiraceae bacterium]|nr:hypothetical protein [Lachnospiraceae bacterium]
MENERKEQDREKLMQEADAKPDSERQEPGTEPAKDAITGAGTGDSSAVERPVAELLLEVSRRQLFYARLAAIFTGALLVVTTIVALILVPRVTATLEHANILLTNAGDSLEELDEMSESLTQTSEAFNKLVGDNADTLTDSVNKLSSIDFEGINTAIDELHEAVGPLAEAMNKLSTTLKGFSIFGR